MGHLLARGGTTLALGGEIIGNMRIGGARRSIGSIGIHLVRGEHLMKGARGGLLRRVGLIGRSGMGRGRRLIRLVRVRWWEGSTATEASLR